MFQEGGFLIKVSDLTIEQKIQLNICIGLDICNNPEFITMIPNDEDGYNIYYMTEEEDILRCRKLYRDNKINLLLNGE